MPAFGEDVFRVMYPILPGRLAVSAIRHADSIVVIEDGRVVDQGTHGDLKARAGYYQDICRVQDA